MKEDISAQNRYAAECYLKMKKDSAPEGEGAHALQVTQVLNYTKTHTQPVYNVLPIDLNKAWSSEEQSAEQSSEKADEQFSEQRNS